MSTGNNDNLDLTRNAWSKFYKVVDNPEFNSDWNQAAQMLSESLKNELQIPAFGEYLKRYIHAAQGLEGDYGEKDLSYYVDSILENFAIREVPASFQAGTTPLRTLANNCLKRKTVSRKTVFLLGFGFGMSVDDVNNFLQKGLCEQAINPKDPFEVICWYCFKNNFGYGAFEELTDEYLRLEPSSGRADMFSGEETSNIRYNMLAITNEDHLLAYLAGLKATQNLSKFSRTAKREFMALYDKVREIIAEDENKNIDEISRGDVEAFIYSGIPKTPNGNLVKNDLSELADVLQGSRLDRNRIGKILSDEVDVTRFDLITLNFFIHAHREYVKPLIRYHNYCEDTDKILKKCAMQELIIQNPYENFVLACTLAKDPMGTYWDVWDMSFDNN